MISVKISDDFKKVVFASESQSFILFHDGIEYTQ